MLRKGYVFLLVVFLCKTLTGISCNSGGNAPAGELEQIFPMVRIFFSFLSPLFSFLCGSDSAEEWRTLSHPVCLTPVSNTPRCRSVRGLPTGLETTGSAGPLSPYLLRETTWGPMRSGWCPLAAEHKAPGRGRGIGSCLRRWEHCRSVAVWWGRSCGLHRIIPTCMVLPEWSPSFRGLAGAMKFVSLQVLLIHIP